MIDKSLLSLDEMFRIKIYKLIAKATEQAIYFKVLETLRTVERQKELFKEGKSKTLNSRHLNGEAVDLVPIVSYEYPKVRELIWTPHHDVWEPVRKLAEVCGVTWGGNWVGFPDYFHFQDR